MIQLKRGSTESWKKLKKPLAAGQPGYDKDKHRLKVGDGETLWEKLKAVGLSKEEILDSEQNAKLRLKEDPESLAIITYGPEDPDKNTAGELYLQHYETAPEVDYVVDYGVDGIWSWRKWNSGNAECYGALTFETAIKNPFESSVETSATNVSTSESTVTKTRVFLLYSNSTEMTALNYPFSFVKTAYESVSLQSSGAIAWLAGKSANTKSKTGTYAIVGPHKEDNKKYTIVFQVSGRWK